MSLSVRAIVYALPRHQSHPVRRHYCGRIGGSEALPGLRSANRIATACVATRHSLAMARQAGRSEHGLAYRGDVLVRVAISTHVSGYSGNVAERSEFLASACGGMRSYGGALFRDGLARTALWITSLVMNHGRNELAVTVGGVTVLALVLLFIAAVI